MRPALLDVNVLLALAWPNHQHHAEAHVWFGHEAIRGWATIAFTELGFIRLSSNPAYTPAAVSPREAAALLTRLLAHRSHRFWPSPSAIHAADYAQAIGHQQVNDAYLVTVAHRQKGRLVTFDRRLLAHPHGAGCVTVIGGPS